MTKVRGSSLDELVQSVSDLVDHVKVLVTAIDDLRCEVEWWARNRVDDSHPATLTQPCAESMNYSDREPSAADRLSRLEAMLRIAPRAAWPKDFDDDEPPELPTGRIVSVDEDRWSGVLDFRPVHIVGMGCDCEEGASAPYLLAWQDSGEFYLRELTPDEADELQSACLAAQREAAALNPSVENPPAQLVLWD